MSEHDTIAPALVAALADLTVVEKGRTADTGKYSYDYADLADVVKLTRPVLARHGIVALTPVHSAGAELACTVTLLHRSGDRLDFGPFTFPHGRDAQATGSWVTYIRRYALTAALGMAAGDDDDGAKAQPRQQPPKRQERPQEPPPGEPVAKVKAALVERFEEAGVASPKEHAKAVWEQAEVPTIDGRWISPDEVAVIEQVAVDYLADLAAVNA